MTRRTGARVVVWSAITGLLLAACADSASPPLTAPDDPAERFGACRSAQGDVDHMPADSILALAEEWLEIRSVSDADAATASVEGGETDAVVMDVQAWDEASDAFVGPSSSRPIAIHTSMLPGLVWGLDVGGHSYVALASKNLEREMVAYALVETPEGDYFFAGSCQFDALTAPLRRSLGDDYGSTMKRMVGLTGAREIEQLLSASRMTDGTSQSVAPVLNPQDVPPAELANLDQVTFAFNIPQDWTGEVTICSKIPTGWNDCFSLEEGRAPTTLIDAYVDASMKVEIWLLDQDAHLSSPIQLLDTIDLSTISDRSPESKLGVVIRVELSGAYLPGDGASSSYVRDPSAAIADLEAWEVLLTDPERSQEVADVDLTEGHLAGSSSEALP